MMLGKMVEPDAVAALIQPETTQFLQAALYVRLVQDKYISLDRESRDEMSYQQVINDLEANSQKKVSVLNEHQAKYFVGMVGLRSLLSEMHTIRRQRCRYRSRINFQLICF